MARSLDNSSYERYKASLHAIFDGRAPLPTRIRDLANAETPSAQEAPKETVPEPAPVKSTRRRSAGTSSYSIFIEALKQASTHEEMQRAVGALKEAKLSFPAEEDLLSKVLTHPDEAIVLEVLDHLDALFTTQAPKSPRLLATRLEDAAFLCKPGIAKDRILAMKQKFRA